MVPYGRKVMSLRALKLSGIAALVFVGMAGVSQPAAAQCGCGGYAVAPVVVQPYSSCCSCGCGGSAYYGAGYYGAGYGYGYYGAAGGAYALDYGYAPSVVVAPRYSYGRRWGRGYWGY